MGKEWGWYNLRTMEAERTAFFRSTRLLVGHVIGVGIFGLPYVVAQAGYSMGILALVVSGALSTAALLMYADMAIHTKGHARFVGFIRDQAGPIAGFFAALAHFGGIVGGMTAYILIGGTFAYEVFGEVVGGTVAFWRIAFFALSALAVFGGMLTVARLQKVLIALYVGLILVMAALAVPNIQIEHYLSGTTATFFLPFGVALFAFTGMGAIPEMRDMLGRQKHLLRRSVITGTVAIGLLYVIFVTAVVGVTGLSTSPESLRGLAEVLGKGFLVLGSAVGLCTVTTAFMSHALSLTNTLVYDFRLRYLVSWAIAVTAPLIMILLGANDFIRIINVTGGAFIGLAGLMLIAAYEQMRRKPTTAKRMLAIPQWIVFLTGCGFAFNIALALFGA